MRIKLNLSHLIPDRNSSVYWLHVDDKILFIKQLKEKVQKVLKESHDIELCLDNIPFLDEDDICAINENEEITVTVKKINNFTETYSFKDDTKESNINTIQINENPSNSTFIHESSDFKCDNDSESLISLIPPKNSKKRVRKRKHTKKKQEFEFSEPVKKNGFSDTQPEIPLTSPITCSKLHKRFKVDNEENNHEDDGTSESSDDDRFQVTRDVFVCNSSLYDKKEIKKNIQSDFKKEAPLRTKVMKVPIFVRGQTGTSKNSVLLSENKSDTSEECVFVVDWKDMTPIKVSNLLELQVCDLIKFKMLSMNESGEPVLSPFVTARIDIIFNTTLHIDVLSGIKEFMNINEKFKMDEEDPGTQRQVDYNDIFEIFKLT